MAVKQIRVSRIWNPANPDAEIHSVTDPPMPGSEDLVRINEDLRLKQLYLRVPIETRRRIHQLFGEIVVVP